MKAVLKHLVENINLPEDEYLEQEAEIFEIFTEEVEEILGELVDLVPQWIANSDDHDVLVTIRRYFHTLKGSGRMVGAKSSGELAWTVESLLNNVISQNVSLTLDVQRYVQAVVNLYQYKLFDEFKLIEAHKLDFRPLVLLGQRLQQQEKLESELEELLNLADNLTSVDIVTGLELSSDDVDEQPATEILVAQTDDAIVPQTDIVVSSPYADLKVSPEMLEIFLDESKDNIEIINLFLSKDNPTTDDYNRLVRAVHTLRGSSAMIGLEPITKISQYIEKSFEHQSTNNDEHNLNQAKELLTDYKQFTESSLSNLQSKNHLQLDELYQNFVQKWPLELDAFDETVQLDTVGIVTQLLELDIGDLLDTEFDFLKRSQEEHPTYLNQLLEQTQNLMNYPHHQESIFIRDYSEIMNHAYSIVLDKSDMLKEDAVQEAFAGVHQQFVILFDTLASGQSIDMEDEHHECQQLLALLHRDEISEQQEILVGQNDEVEDLSTEIELSSSVTEQSSVSQGLDVSALISRINIDKSAVDSDLTNRNFDADLLDIFLEEADELQVNIDVNLEQWSQDNTNTNALNSLMRYLHTLKGGANMVQATQLGLVAHELESVYENIIAQIIPVSDDLVRLIRVVQDELSERVQVLRDEQIDYPSTETVGIVKNIMKYVSGQMLAVPEKVVAPIKEPVPVVTAVEPKVVEEPIKSTTQETVLSVSKEESIEDIIEAEFLDESSLLLSGAQELLTQWKEERNNRNVLLRLQRTIHSLKGASRLANRTEVAEVAAQLEHTFEQFAVYQFNSSNYDQTIQDTLRWFRTAIFDKDYSLTTAILESLRNIRYDSNEESELVDDIGEILIEDSVMGDGTEPPSMLGEWGETDQVVNNAEMIRISSDVIDKMLDLSGEASINRSRIEMDLNTFSSTLSEMELTIKRLADQLRRMQGELESQILARHGGESARYEDFDPLEMDQYSSLNQLSKSLAESASDLLDFKATMTTKLSDTEGLLLQQFRLQNEMQESLMRTRLVPFSPMLPRLQRIVRQTAAKLDKPVEFITDKTEGEFDRNILDHLITPFEHMLRNAIDHGLETRDERSRTLKPEAGRIELKIERQGTDIVATLKDDGRGIDVRRIRRKAIEFGLMQDKDELEREEILQFIFHHGFSTAQSVSEISGRGVGLDVVQNEIKELGGHLTVDSIYGEGTTFTIRLPTTVAMSDALMVKHGDQQYAVPLAQIDRMVRIEPRILEAYFKSKAEQLNIDNQNYRLRYLSEFIADQPTPRFTDMNTPLPVLLLKATSGQRVAILVDQLSGSREQVVVKPIGEQFSSVGIIAGATILGDGRVCLILDTPNMIRQIQTSSRLDKVSIVKEKEPVRQRDQRHLIMIVDDSVTVRKVTSRLLERQGYDVVTAKDGVDAMEKLETVRPDLMLLDIEMPRMDGFEVTTLVRRHEVHQNLPIIMITSRTGEKHRERALSLGVTQYMGKPFQEEELVQSIRSHLTEQVEE